MKTWSCCVTLWSTRSGDQLTTHNSLSVEALHQNILADFSPPIGAVGVFVSDKASCSGCLKFLHDLHSFPGAPGHSRERMVTMGYEGDVSGLDICTVAFDPDQLAITADTIVPGTLERVQQLLNDEPGRDTLGPFKATDVNVGTTKISGMGYLPLDLMEPLLGADLNARQVFELVVPGLIDTGLQDACTSLINFLRW
jgi:hypothetical protein